MRRAMGRTRREEGRGEGDEGGEDIPYAWSLLTDPHYKRGS